MVRESSLKRWYLVLFCENLTYPKVKSLELLFQALETADQSKERKERVSAAILEYRRKQGLFIDPEEEAKWSAVFTTGTSNGAEHAAHDESARQPGTETLTLSSTLQACSSCRVDNLMQQPAVLRTC